MIVYPPRMTYATSGKRTVGQDRMKMAKEAARRYKKGDSIRKIGAEMQVSYGKAHRLLMEAGVAFRERGGAMRKARR